MGGWESRTSDWVGDRDLTGVGYGIEVGFGQAGEGLGVGGRVGGWVGGWVDGLRSCGPVIHPLH